MLITGSLESVHWLKGGGALNILSREMLRTPKAFGSFMIIRQTFLKLQSLVGIYLHRMLS